MLLMNFMWTEQRYGFNIMFAHFWKPLVTIWAHYYCFEYEADNYADYESSDKNMYIAQLNP